MLCGNCGIKNTNNSKFCTDCGSKLETWRPPTSLAPEDLDSVADAASRERLKKLLEMAFWHKQVGNADGAILACEAAIVINPRSTTAYSLLANLYEKKGEDDKAVAALEKVIEINPNSAADKTRLELLKQGIRVKAIEPPPLYKWMPPVLATRAPGSAGNMPRWAMLGAAAIVLSLGILAVTSASRRGPSTSDHPMQIATSSAPPAGAQPVGPVPISDPTVPAPSSAAPPTTSAPSTVPAPPVTATVMQGTDPFLESLRKQAEDLIVKKPAAPVKIGKAPAELPPLGLRPIPTAGSGTIPPAPINVPDSVQTTERGGITTPPVPQHTVVVSDLDGGRQAPPAAGSGASGITVTTDDGSPDGGVAPDMQDAPGSHIHISVSDGPVKSDRSNSSPGAGASSSRLSPDGYQNQALQLQSHGDYDKARVAYEKAIRGYKTQIAMGTNTESAQRGIQACQIGLQICRQYQP
jgi:tetratricopeptide (TPR) repeat protein